MIFKKTNLCFCIAFLMSISVFSQSWTSTIPATGTFSSPRVADLNGDGTDDIILGTGRLEFQATDTAVIALDGKTGKMLWHVPAIDQMFGSAIFQDIDQDGHPDVLISGRSSELILISGYSGNVIWRFDVKAKKNKYKRWFNFYNPQWIPDEDGDGLMDILVSNGGDVKVAAYDPKRAPGHILIMSSKSGDVLHIAEMPDHKEIYMSITATPLADQSDYEIIYGTGGETIGGHLYRGLLSQVRNGDLSPSILLDSTADRGYIGPAARADVTGDGVTDIFVNAVNGRLLAYDGKSYKKLWETKRPDTETYSSIAIGLFNEDTIPDLFASYAMGSWPKLDWSTQFMADGKTGKIGFIDSLGFYQNGSAVVVDWDGDGKDEVVFSVNFQEIKNGFQKFFYNMLVLIDFKTKEVSQISDTYDGNNISSTPWAGDLDHDGFLDIIYPHGTNNRHTYTFDGLQVHRISTKIPIKKKVKWGSYQGSEYTGVYD
jgi:outer membrane protein assembly factor BamB